jgi:EmrB/QacA subfamily drug resistance transporter
VEVSRPRLVIGGVMVSIFLAAMESTVVATAMPTVVQSLGGIDMYSWVFSAFLLTSTVTMPLWGRLSDLVGRRRTYVTGLVVFLTGSALAGLAQSMGQLIAFRALQGVGAGSLITLGMTVIGDLYGLERRARMQGYFSGVWGVASLAGPLLGGLLADHVSWRWAFYVNLPFGVVAIGLITAGLRDAASSRRPRIDYAGAALFTAGVSSLLVGLAQGGRSPSWWGLEVLGPLALALALGLVLLLVERRASEPIIPFRLFGIPLVRAAAATGFLAGMAMFGAISFVPLFLQRVTDATATAAGFVLTPFVLGWVTCSIVSARLVLKIGYRAVVFVGMICLTTAFFQFSEWDVTLTRLAAMGAVLVAGAGMGLTMVPMLIAVQSAVTTRELGSATSLTQFFRTIGGAVGVSIMGAVMAQRLGRGLEMEAALHGVFLVGLIVCAGALLSAFLVPAGSAQELARPETVVEPFRTTFVPGHPSSGARPLVPGPAPHRGAVAWPRTPSGPGPQAAPDPEGPRTPRARG